MPSLIRLLTYRMCIDPLAWSRDTRRMRQLVSAFAGEATVPHGDKPHFGVVLTPWMGTAVPWFSLVTGLFLAAKGNKVTFIVDDMPFGGDALSSRIQLRCIRSVLEALAGRFRILTVSEQPCGAPLSSDTQRSLERLANLNAVWALRGEMKTSGRRRIGARALRQLRHSYEPIGHTLRKGHFDAVLVPGGVWGSSGVWVEHANANGVRVASYDSGGYGNLLMGVGGIACQLQDIPRAFAMLKTHAQEHDSQRFIVDMALAEIGRRRAGVDKFASQLQGKDQSDPRFANAVLIALNSSWDSAALGLHVVFENSNQWIVETTRYLLEHTSVPVVIRQHPVERLAIASTTDDYRALLEKHFPRHPRVHFIAADEAVNSYSLLEQVCAVVVYTSTIGLEAAAHGKPVITASRSYYADLGFVNKAVSLAQYHLQLAGAVSGQLPVSATMREDALCCYYLTQCCNWIFTPFTVPEFHEWVARDLRSLSEEPSVQRVLVALENNIPVAYLNHLGKMDDRVPVPVAQ